MRIARRYQHMVKSIEGEGGLIDDCTHMVYLTEGYEHHAYGDSFPVRNTNELRLFLLDVAHTDEKVVDVACITTAKLFFDISSNTSIDMHYLNEDEEECGVNGLTGSEFLEALFNDSNNKIYKTLHLNKTFTVKTNGLTYIIHGYDISWWRKHLSRLANYFTKHRKTAGETK